MADLIYSKRDEAPEGLREHGKEVDGKFVVKVAPQSKLDEFRDNNLSLSRERDALKAQTTLMTELIGPDPEKFKGELTTLRGLKQQVDDGKIKGSEAIEVEVVKRVSQMKDGFEGQLREAGTKLAAEKARGDSLETEIRRSIVDRGVTEAVLAKDSGVNPAALPDIMHRAYEVFTVTADRKLVAKKGDAIIYGSDGATPMTPREWLVKVLADAPYLGAKAAGGGATGGKGENRFGMPDAEFQNLPAAERLRRARAAK